LIDQGKSAVIYLIDDQPHNLELMSSFLRNQGYEVITQTDCWTAVTEVPQILPDLILFNVLMAKSDGFEVCTSLKSAEATKNIPLIFVNGLIAGENTTRGLEVSARDSLTKPIPLPELLSRIKTCLKFKQLKENLVKQNKILAQEIKERKKAELALQESETRLKAIIDSNFNGIVIIDPDGNILFVNVQAAKIFRRKQQQMMGENLGILLDFNRTTEWEIPHPNQELTTVEARAVPIIWQGKNAYLIFLTDITDKKKMEEELSILFQVSEQSPAIIMITDTSGKIEYVNPKFEQISGYSKEEVIGKNPHILKSGHTNEQEYQQLWQTITQGKEWTGEFHNRRKNGELYWEKALISPLFNSVGAITHFIAVKEDITKQKQQETLLEYQAKYDNLTNIPNRNYALTKIEQMIVEAQATKTEFALMFIDLDHFKEVNDNFGHEYGDELLIRATQRMKHNLRSSDLLGRLGGDEFLIAIPHLKQKKDVTVIGHKIINSLEQPFHILDEILSISASIGVTFFPDEADNLEQLISNADIAMYKAKNNGRHQLQFFQSANFEDTTVKFSKSQSKTTIKTNREADFQQALGNGEFKLVYQPIINLEDNLVSRVEVFLRWQSPESGLLYPHEFIPAIENNGMIFPLEIWLLKSILAQSQTWQTTRKIPIHLNLSVHQFQSHRIINTLNQALPDSQQSYPDLVLEIKEEVFLAGNYQLKEILETIKGLNLEISLDNFGSGVSSLTNLHKFPWQSVKIDTTLVNNLAHSQESINLAKSIIEIAQLLNLKIIAQGIETQEQLNILKSLGCQYGQGYFFSQPLSVSELQKYLNLTLLSTNS
jgi:diguanylate cyclase (GGDEF)-like protein/PAS domain S-box-containing protein